MHIDIPNDLESFVEQEFATGRYATREEVLVQDPARADGGELGVCPVPGQY